jgi:hypothetical protein
MNIKDLDTKLRNILRPWIGADYGRFSDKDIDKATFRIVKDIEIILSQSNQEILKEILTLVKENRINGTHSYGDEHIFNQGFNDALEVIQIQIKKLEQLKLSITNKE